jgi:hypothetical protein
MTITVAVVALSALVTLGWVWDISWQTTIGQTGFWTPPHITVLLAGVGFGVLCVRAVKSWSDRQPGARLSPAFVGSILGICGVLVMLGAAFYDYWWHATQLPQTMVLIPPHKIGAGAIVAIQTSAVLITLANLSEVPGQQSRWATIVYVVSAGLLLFLIATLATEYVGRPNLWQSSGFYKASGLVFPVLLVALGLSPRLKWGATAVAGIYMAVALLMIWVLQLIPAQPRLTPVHNPVTHMVPPPFPLLLLLPAVAIDLLKQIALRSRFHISDWVLAGLIGVTFVGIMWVAHWYFADLLLSSLGRTYFFAADQWPFYTRLGPWRYQQWVLDSGASTLLKRIALAVLFAAASARVGLWVRRAALAATAARESGVVSESPTAVS